jgi:hypothetical protein
MRESEFPSLARALEIGIGKEEEEGSAEGRGRNHGGESSREVFEAVPIPAGMQKEEFIEVWSDWVEYRLECGRKYRWPTTVRCFRRTMKFCQSIGVRRAVKAIDRSIQLGYRGVFEDRNEQRKQTTKEDSWDGLR